MLNNVSDFDILAEQYTQPDLIPDDVLYQFIKRTDTWENLRSVSSLGLEVLLKAPLVQEVRRRSKADLFWLSKYFLWETTPEGEGQDISQSWITEDVHRRVCDLFIKKDDTKSIAQQDVVYKKRLILYPRGSLKSSIDMCDVIQWILNFPQIRILYYTAAKDLAAGFVSQTRGHFLIHPEEPTLMNVFFPEFCVTESQLGNEYEFNCPVWLAKRIKRVEPTLLASSVESAVAGKHFELIKADDAVSDKNSENEDQCKKVSRNISKTSKTLRGFGYFDKIGTRYHDSDDYGTTLDKYNIGSEIEYEHGPSGVAGPVWEIISNKAAGLKILIGRGIVIKPERAQELTAQNIPVTYKNAGEDGVHLLFPQHQGFSWCLKEYADNEEVFEGQINQNPRPPSRITFDRPLLLRQTRNFQEMPIYGPISQTWDFAFSKKKGRDYTTGSAVLWDKEGRFYVIDLIRQRFTPTELGKAVVDFAKKHRPFKIRIEDASGSRLIEPTIIRMAEETKDEYIIKICSTIEWFPPDNQIDAKRTRMASLHPWLVQDRMRFANYLPQINIVYDEFERCLVSPRHDDIPDVISQQIPCAPAVRQMMVKNEVSAFSRDEVDWNIMFEEADAFGRIGMGYNPPPIVQTIEVEEDTQPDVPVAGWDPILGAGLFG